MVTLEELGGRSKQLSHGSAANFPAADTTAASFQRFSQPLPCMMLGAINNTLSQSVILAWWKT